MTADGEDPAAAPVSVAVVIVSRNRPRLLLDMVQSILAGDELPTELVIVDQSDVASTEVAALSHPHACVRYLLVRERGLSHGRNAGAAAASSDVLVFADDDMLASRHWLAALTSTLIEAGERSVVTGRVVPGTPERRRTARVATALGERRVVYRGRLDTDVLAGGNLALRREALLGIGGWDARLGAGSSFPAAEDNDLGFRLLEHGHSIVFVPEAELIHRAWRRREHYLVQRWRYGRGKGGFYAKHLRTSQAHMLRRLGLDLAARFRALPANLVRRPPHAVAEAVYGLGVVCGVLHWLATTRAAPETHR